MGSRQLVMGLGLAVAVAGCSGTPLGERLSASFPQAGGGSAPQAAPATPAPSPAPGPPSAGSAAPTPGPPAAPKPTRPAERSQGPSPRPASQPAPAAKALPPAPYRLTLRLPAADPAAPAEAVTQALRAAGVSFEVERIEQAAPAPPSPVMSAPAPATSQPAPPPR